MIANIGPASMNYEETIITLRYAYRAKSIKNQPIKNEDIKDAKLLELQREIERLKQLILAKGDGQALPNGSVSDVTDEEGETSDTDNEEEKEKEKMLEAGKLEVDELGKKLRTLEKQMVHGGKNIVDSVNENEIKLEQQRSEIAARKVNLKVISNFIYLFNFNFDIVRNGRLRCNSKLNWKKRLAWNLSMFLLILHSK